MEWNGHSLVGKTFDEVHDVITESRLDPQVELRVARSLTGSHAHATPTGTYATDSLGRPVLGPDPRQIYHQNQSSRSYFNARGGRGPSVTLSDPLGGTTHMLNPPANLHRHPDSTRIQVGWVTTPIYLFFKPRPLLQIITTHNSAYLFRHSRVIGLSSHYSDFPNKRAGSTK